MKKNKERTVDVLREVEALHRHAAAVDASSVVGDMRWYAAARQREKMVRGAISTAACVAVFVLAMAVLPEREYYYMVGDNAGQPQAVCADISTVFKEV